MIIINYPSTGTFAGFLGVGAALLVLFFLDYQQ
jgi:hypothetical protein